MGSHLCELKAYNCTGPRVDFVQNEQAIDYNLLLGIEKGSYEYGVGSYTGRAYFGDLVIVPANYVFKRKSLEEITYHVFQYVPTGAFIDMPYGKVTLGDIHRLGSTYAYLHQTWRVHGKQSCTADITSHMLMDLLHMAKQEIDQVQSRKKEVDPLMQQAAGYIRLHLFDATRMKRIAQTLGIMPSELTRRFRMEFGVTPVEYAIRLRLEEAKRLLCDTNDTLEEIAVRCGYENGSYLSRIFHSRVGITATAFRKRNQM